MRYISKFNSYQESLGYDQETIKEINEILEFHSYHIWGIEFKLDNDTIEEMIDCIDSISFSEANGRTGDENRNAYKERFEEILNKYRGWEFKDEKLLGSNKHDHDWCEFEITIVDNMGNTFLGKGDTCPAESPQISQILNLYQSKEKDYKEYLRLKKKWNFD